ncbi:hypothetical protein H4I96_05241 [Botrytis cinerea]
MNQLFVVITLVVFAVVGVLFFLYYVCQKWEAFHHDPLDLEAGNYEMGSWEHRGTGFDGDDGDREGGTAAARDNGITTAGAAGEASDGDSGILVWLAPCRWRDEGYWCFLRLQAKLYFK